MPTAPIECGSTLAKREVLADGDLLSLLSPDEVAVETAAGILVQIGDPIAQTIRTVGVSRVATDSRASQAHRPAAGCCDDIRTSVILVEVIDILLVARRGPTYRFVDGDYHSRTVAQSHSPNAVRRSSWIDTGTTTAPAGQIAWRKAQVAALDAGEPSPPYPAISDDDIRATLECNQLRLLRERGADMTIFSPRPSTMAPYIGDETAAKAWARTNSDLIARCVALYLPIFRRRLHAAAESAGRSGRVDRRALMLRTRPRLYRLQPQSPIAAAATSARRR